MEIGYIPDKNAPLREEILFGIQHFDFLELSYSEELNKYRDLIAGFPVIGHSSEDETLLTVEKSLEFFSSWDVKFYVVHLSPLDKKQTSLLLEKLKEEYGIPLLAENSKRGPYASCAALEEWEITLDVGHAILSGQLDCFLQHKKIKHLHLHDVFAGKDHVKILNSHLLEIMKRLNVPTLLEIFYDVRSQQVTAFSPEERRRYLLELKGVLKI